MKSHEEYMRRANRLALQAAHKGNEPFGALLVHEDKIIAEGENTIITDEDFTRHAELNLVVAASRTLPPEILEESTLYASTAPCLMCAAAIWKAGIRRVVYGVTYDTFSNLVPGTYRYVSIEEAFKLLQTPIETLGGVLEEECLKTYQYWPKESQ
jgi:tRNA(Arg) A34 adenosine deaminase TadA